MLKVEQQPSLYRPMNDLFSDDQKQIYGVLIQSTGKRYSKLINGSRKSGWGKGQNRDFQETFAFLALRHQGSLEHALKKKHTFSKEQMLYWMQDITEITLLDYIFSQQDRIGNIDYTKVWLSNKNGKVARSQHSSGSKAIKIKQTHLNDNDAGGRMAYSNFTKTTQMLEKIRHYSANTYKKLMLLDKDFKQKGKLYQYLTQTFGLSTRYRDMIVKNTQMAADILRRNCHAKKLSFDLDPDLYFLKHRINPIHQSCDL